VDGVGSVLSYSSSGWSAAQNVDGSRVLKGVSCVGTSFCAAVDSSGYALVDQLAAGLWSTPASVDGSNSLVAVSCASSSFCVAVDGKGNALTYNGSAWSSAKDIDGTNALAAVSCPSSSFCVTVDGRGNELTYNGSSWSSARSIDSTRTLKSVSCSSSSFCAAVDGSGYAVVYKGFWATPVDIDGSNSLNAVSCSSSSFCAAVDGRGNVVTYNGTVWFSPQNFDSTRTLRSVSCPSSSFCVAVDGSGYAMTTQNGVTWSTPSDIDGSHAIDSVSCPIAGSCEAVDGVGELLTYASSGWSAAQDIDAARVLNSVSCPNSSFCAAVDASGYAVRYTMVASNSQLIWENLSDLHRVICDGSNIYIYGPTASPVEEVNLSSASPTYVTFTSADSAWLATNSDGDETGFWRYDGFGAPALGAPISPFGYAGQYTDATTSLTNMRARWYTPSTGGFSTRDPAFPTTDQAYVYAGDDPVNRTDPTGLYIVGCDAASGFSLDNGVTDQPDLPQFLHCPHRDVYPGPAAPGQGPISGGYYAGYPNCSWWSGAALQSCALLANQYRGAPAPSNAVCFVDYTCGPGPQFDCGAPWSPCSTPDLTQTCSVASWPFDLYFNHYHWPGESPLPDCPFGGTESGHGPVRTVPEPFGPGFTTEGYHADCPGAGVRDLWL
jgi:RHS repeat-associated protein